jgi:hypothetical protein
LRLRSLETCANGTSAFQMSSSAMPMPVSETEMLNQPSLSTAAVSLTAPPRGVNLTAFGQQVDQDLLEILLVAEELRQPSCSPRELQPGAVGLGPHEGDWNVDRFDGVEPFFMQLGAAGLDLGQVEDAVDLAQQCMPALWMSLA